MPDEMPPAYHYPFTELVSGTRCVLIIRPDKRLVVRHPNCLEMAAVIPELDAFYCLECHYNGRISGAWARGQADAHR